jgi:hypothetical protein
MDLLDTGATNDEVILFCRRHPRGTPEFMHAAMRGVLTGVTRVVISGYNPDVDVASVPEEVWYGGGLIPRPAGDESWELVSSSANDTAAGTGGRSVSITTLDNSYTATTQTIVPNGLTAVPIPGNCRFINAGRLLTAGSTGGLEGDLTIRVAGGGATRAVIPAADGVLCQAKYTVPAGFSLDLHSMVMGVRSQGGTESLLLTTTVTNSAGVTISPVRFPLFVAGVNMMRHEIGGGVVPFNRIAQRNEFSMRSILVTQNNTVVDVSVLAFLYDNAYWP